MTILLLILLSGDQSATFFLFHFTHFIEVPSKDRKSLTNEISFDLQYLLSLADLSPMLLLSECTRNIMPGMIIFEGNRKQEQSGCLLVHRPSN